MIRAYVGRKKEEGSPKKKYNKINKRQNDSEGKNQIEFLVSTYCVVASAKKASSVRLRAYSGEWSEHKKYHHNIFFTISIDTEWMTRKSGQWVALPTLYSWSGIWLALSAVCSYTCTKLLQKKAKITVSTAIWELMRICALINW